MTTLPHARVQAPGVAALALALALAQAGPALAQDAAANPDPLESLNRSVWRFNQALDRAVLKPLAEGYRAVLPQPVRTGVTNVLGNVGDVWSAANHLLQGKVTHAALMTLRVGTNTVFGLGGLLDPATELDLPRESEDFGQTLGRWGLPAGPYLMLPLLGPSSVRDTSALPLDRAAFASTWIEPTSHAVGVAGLEMLNARSRLLGADEVLAGAALDEYLFLRDGYLARRHNLVWDGDPPREPQDDGAWDDPESAEPAAPSEMPAAEPQAPDASASAAEAAAAAPVEPAAATAAAGAASEPEVSASAAMNTVSAPNAAASSPGGVDPAAPASAASAAAAGGEPNPPSAR